MPFEGAVVNPSLGSPGFVLELPFGDGFAEGTGRRARVFLEFFEGETGVGREREGHGAAASVWKKCRTLDGEYAGP